MRDPEGVAFLQWCLPRLGLRWPGFRKVRRRVYTRIDRRLKELGIPDVAAYRGYLDRHPEEWPVLGAFCRIPISRFLPGPGGLRVAGPGGLAGAGRAGHRRNRPLAGQAPAPARRPPVTSPGAP
jgi:hypothetical protein